VLTLDALPSDGGHPDPDRFGIVDVSSCGASLHAVFHAAAKAVLRRLLGLAPCSVWHCLHNRPGLSSAGLDLCPCCLRKLHHSTGTAIVERYNALAPLYLSTAGFEAAGGWIAERLRYLDPAMAQFDHSEHHGIQTSVVAQYSNGEWYPARVTGRNPDGTVDVLFEDGVVMDALPAEKVREVPAAAAAAAAVAAAVAAAAAAAAVAEVDFGASFGRSSAPVAAAAAPQRVLGNQLQTLKSRHGTKLKGSQRPIQREKAKPGKTEVPVVASPASPPPPPPPQEALSGAQVKACLEAFYNRHHPEKLAGIDRLLQGYSGREAALLAAVESKYGLSNGTLLRRRSAAA